MPNPQQGIAPNPGSYRFTDGTDPSLRWRCHVTIDGLGTIVGGFERVDDPVLGTIYKNELAEITVTFFNDGTYIITKPGPDSTGTYAAL